MKKPRANGTFSVGQIELSLRNIQEYTTMLQPEPSPRDQELLEAGLFAIFQAHVEGKINLQELIRLSTAWAERIKDEDEMLEGCYSSECWDS